jgi:hypothetical protein
MTLPALASAASIILTFVAYAPYLKAIRGGKVKPHFFSWLIWSLTTCIVFFAQLAADGGAGAWPTGVSGAITVYVAWLSLKLRSDLSATKSDWAFLIASLLSLPAWFFTTDPLWSVVILTAVDVLGFGPTLRKAWRYPQEESTLFYLLFSVRSCLSIAALESRTLTTVLFPMAMIISCILVCLLLVWRRSQLRQ